MRSSNPVSRNPVSPFKLFTLLVGFVLLAVACGDDAPTTFAVDNEEAFFAACTNGETDELLQQRVCQCAYDEARANMSFERFTEINDLMEADPEAALPADLLGIVGACVVEEGDL